MPHRPSAHPAPQPPTAPGLTRRHWLHTGAAGLLGHWLGGCTPAPRDIPGGFTSIGLARGHALRDQAQAPQQPSPPAPLRRTQVLIAGGGVAGLAAARALRLAGVHDFALLELEDQPGGNSRGMQLHGLACPMGAHYLPLPGPHAHEVQDLLEELGLRFRHAGRWQYDERHLCHSPQERLFHHGGWSEGLLPPAEQLSQASLAQYQRFADAVAAQAQVAAFTMPTWRSWSPPHSHGNHGAPASHLALDQGNFADWLAQHGITDPHLRWYLDYCCRDDFGAGSARISAWAGVHYFASRHGFHVPGQGSELEAEREGLLTWPEGNGWLTQRLAAPLQRGSPDAQLHTATSVLRVQETRDGVLVDALNHTSGQLVRWQAHQAILALPVYVARRVVDNAPDWLHQAAQHLHWAPWLVANIHLDKPLQDRPGAAPAWDNVLYQDPNPGGLGYVDAGHQRLDWGGRLSGPTVLSYYQALGDWPDGRQALLERPWQQWRNAILASLAQAHPDIYERTTHVALTRYGHAMAMPLPGTLNFLRKISPNRLPAKGQQLSKQEYPDSAPTPHTNRLWFAHADWSGYSVFEEAFTRGHSAGAQVAQRLRQGR